MLRLSFSTSFLGTKNIYMRANSQFGSTTGLVLRGTWTVAAPIQAGSVITSAWVQLVGTTSALVRRSAPQVDAGR